MLDFIERYFGVSPDGGDGLVEVILIWFLIFFGIVALAIVLRRHGPKHYSK